MCKMIICISITTTLRRYVIFVWIEIHVTSLLWQIWKLTISPLAIKCHGNDSALKPANGRAVCTTPDYSYQTTCFTLCDDGYSSFEEQKTTECLSNKQWSHVLPGCKGKLRYQC